MNGFHTKQIISIIQIYNDFVNKKWNGLFEVKLKVKFGNQKFVSEGEILGSDRT